MGCDKPERHNDHVHVFVGDDDDFQEWYEGSERHLNRIFREWKAEIKTRTTRMFWYPEASDTLTETEIEVTDTGDHDRFAHYVYDPEVPKARIIEAMIEGKPLRALCGKLWVPSRDPDQYPICPDCLAVKDELIRRSQQ